MKRTQTRATGRQYGAVVITVLALMTPAPFASGEAGSAPAGELALVDVADVAAPRIDDPISAAELEDLKTLASQNGMSLEEAIDQYAWTDNFALAVSAVRDEFPNAFSGAAIVGKHEAWVGFAADAPKSATEIIDSFEATSGPVAVEVRSDFGFSELEIQKGIETVHHSVLEAVGGRNVGTSFDYESRQITSVVASASALDPGGLDALRADATRDLIDSGQGDLLNHVSITVVRLNVPTLGGPTTNSAHIGGEHLSGCTSGFTVEYWDGWFGVATAGHCSDTQSDDGYSLPYQWGHEGDYGDFQWHHRNILVPTYDDFYAGNATTLEVDRRDVSGVGAPVVGQSLCKNGYAGFKDCTYVIQVNVCHVWLCNLVEMDHRTTVAGDSGGPFYWGNTAYGLMYGWRYDPVWPYDRDLFSRADQIHNALNVDIRQ